MKRRRSVGLYVEVISKRSLKDIRHSIKEALDGIQTRIHDEKPDKLICIQLESEDDTAVD